MKNSDIFTRAVVRGAGSYVGVRAAHSVIRGGFFGKIVKFFLWCYLIAVVAGILLVFKDLVMQPEDKQPSVPVSTTTWTPPERPTSNDLSNITESTFTRPVDPGPTPPPDPVVVEEQAAPVAAPKPPIEENMKHDHSSN